MQLLVRAIDSPTVGKSPRLAWRAGDVVGIFPDGHRFGREERPPTFNVIRVPDLTAAEQAELLDTNFSTVGNVTIDRRKVFVQLDKLPAGDRTLLIRSEQLSLTKLDLNGLKASR